MKRLIRPKADRKLAGVCLAIANYFGIDVTIVRIIFIFLGLPGGAPGILLYILLWIAIPEK